MEGAGSLTLWPPGDEPEDVDIVTIGIGFIVHVGLYILYNLW